MDVVGHQNLGVQHATLAYQRLAELLQVGMVVLFVEEARLTIMSPLHNVERDSIEMDTAAAGHSTSIAAIEAGPFSTPFRPEL